MLPVADQVPVSGSYNSAEVSFSSLAPPTTSTRPSSSRTVVWPSRGVPIVPVAIQAPAEGVTANAGGGETPAGMYNSAEPPLPATRTVPSSSNVAEPAVGMTIFSVTVQVPLSGS